MKSPFSSSSKRRRQKRIPPEANGCLSTVTRHSEPCHFSRKGLNVYLTAFSDRAAWHSGWNACISTGKDTCSASDWISKHTIWLLPQLWARLRQSCNLICCSFNCSNQLGQLVQVGLWSSSRVAAYLRSGSPSP